MQYNFDDIRPFYDDEVNKAVNEIIAEPDFTAFLKYIFPGRDRKEIFDILRSCHTLFEFQSRFTYDVVKVVVARSIDKLTTSGLDKLDKNGVYLFMSNHRDIVLDPALMDLILFENSFNIPHLAIGNNLLVSPLISKIFRLNRSFIVQRNDSPRQMYEAWKKLSAYIYHVITERKENLWIAQREGRAKDGDDRTQTGILKMFLMNLGDDFRNTIRALNIIPVSITYEYDPCDYLKALELYHTTNNLPFRKDAKFNFDSMITGVDGKKGGVHIAFGRPVSELMMNEERQCNLNEWVKWLANVIDTEIHRNYHLWPTNYIACDLLLNNNANECQYSDAEKQKFLIRLRHHLKDFGNNKEELRKLILLNYANSVINQKAAMDGKTEG